MARPRKRPSHLCSPQIHWGDMPKQRHDKPTRAGDWSCVKCCAHNFARRDRCYNCGDRSADKRRCGYDAETRLADVEVQPGDWQCTTCGNLCYARKHKCFHGSARRGSIQAIVPFPHQLRMPGD
eukprot:5902402-Prymnesium_polylepis.2